MCTHASQVCMRFELYSLTFPVFVSTVEVRYVNGVPCVRGALLAKGPDSSFGEVHRGSCSGNIHMEDQEDEVEDGKDK